MCSHREKRTDHVGKMVRFASQAPFLRLGESRCAEGGQQQAHVGNPCAGQGKELVAGNGAAAREAVQEVFISSAVWYLFYVNR